MKISNAEIEKLSISPALIALGKNKEFPANISYRIALFMAVLLPVIDVYQKVKLELIIKYCDKDEKGLPIITNNQYFFTEHKEIFNVEFEKLQAEENNIPGKLELSLNVLPVGLLSSFEMRDLMSIVEFKED